MNAKHVVFGVIEKAATIFPYSRCRPTAPNSLGCIAAATYFLLIALCAQAEEVRLFTHTAQNGDTLIKLANRYLIRPADWQIIEKFNAIKNPRQIPLGTSIRIPVSAMRVDQAPAEILAMQGAVASTAGSVVRGGKVMEGDQLTTGEGGFVTIKLADGSTLTVQPKSTVRMETARQLVNSGGVTDTVVRLDSGRLETSVTTQKNTGARYEIRTPTSNMGVRGTIFRVGADESGKRGQGEVVDGLVAVTSSSVPAATALSRAEVLALRGGFGTFVEAGKPPSPPIALLAAPEVAVLPTQFQKPDVRFIFPAVPAALSYRAQIATDIAFTNLLANATSSSPDVVFVNLPDGTFFLRVRGVDVNGLEGKDATHIFSVQARPLPPLLAQPRDNSGLSSGRLTLVWLPSIDARAYRVQLAEEALFMKPAVDQQVATGVTLTPASSLTPAKYFWRVASVNASGESGPWSATQSFTVSSVAPVINARRAATGMSLEIDGSHAQSHQVQIARDEKFTDMMSDRVIVGNKFDLGQLSANTYYIRARASASGGQISGTWSEVRLLEVYTLSGGWWLSMPLSPVPPSAPAQR